MQKSVGYYFLVAAAVIIVLAGIKAAAPIIVPFLLAIFLTIILLPLFNWICSKGIPEGVSLLAVMFLFVGMITLLAMLVGNSAQDFTNNLPNYLTQLESRFSTTLAQAAEYGLVFPREGFKQIFDPQVLVKYSTTLLSGMGSVLTNSFVILLMVIFMILESHSIVSKVSTIRMDNVASLSGIIEKIKHYMVLKTVISIGTGVTVTLMLMVIGVDYAILWGVIAFLFNYIPNIGSIIAAVPVVLLTFIQLDALNTLFVAIGFVVINTLFGSVIEPKVMGKGLGLSTLVVFISLIFWGWLLGPVGMLLSIPLTIMVKLILDDLEHTRWIALLLGSESEGKRAD